VAGASVPGERRRQQRLQARQAVRQRGASASGAAVAQAPANACLYALICVLGVHVLFRLKRRQNPCCRRGSEDINVYSRVLLWRHVCTEQRDS